MNTALPLEASRRIPQSYRRGSEASDRQPRSVIRWTDVAANRWDHEAICINVPSKHELLDIVRSRLETSTGFTLATVNLDHVVKLRSRSDFRTAYRAQDLIVADGNPIVWLSRLAGRDIEVIPGADLVLPLMGLAAEMQAGIALVGSTATSLSTASERLGELHPDLNIVGCKAPSADFDPTGPEADEIIQFLEASEAKLCFLALGAPKQEVFAAYARQRLGSIGFISIGAGLDFISGKQTRAPRLMRRFALEWAWRLALSPRRLAGRYAMCAAILPLLARDALLERSHSAASRYPRPNAVSESSPILISELK